MNRFLSILFLILTVTNAVFSQDLLLFENGEKKEVKILEINPSDIKYKKFSFAYRSFLMKLDMASQQGTSFQDNFEIILKTK